MKSFHDKLNSYAELLLKVGLNVQKGQTLNIIGDVANVEFIRLVVKKAYEIGASNVHVDYIDEEISLINYKNATDDGLRKSVEVTRVKREKLIEQDAAFLFLVSEDPDLLSSINPDRIAFYQKIAGKAMKVWREATGAEKLTWLIAGVPGKAWADKVFPGEEDAVQKLWDAILETSRVSEGDGVENWKQHIENLTFRSNYLTNKKYAKLHLKAKGTDLTIALHPKHTWNSAGFKTVKGIHYVANIPTEEVFTTPIATGTNGVVSSKKPLSYAGNIIENFQFTFKNGKIVDVTAEKGEEVLKNLVHTDEGSKMLGEVALVPFHSPISNLEILFYNTLYDENASCHLAIGRGFPNCIEDGINMSESELEEVGCNVSITHVDFMVGSSDMDIDGIYSDGTSEPIFRKGNWAF